MSKPTTNIPDIAGLNNVEAALAYAAAGLYVLPVKQGMKHPGSVVGENWPVQSSCDPEVIREWWTADPKYGIALHCGKSGLVVFDVDNPDLVPDDWHAMLRAAPSNATRQDDTGKGHYFFRQPPGKSLGNGKPRLPGVSKGWGDVRGVNGVVILPPSTHPGQLHTAQPKDRGGKYWQRRSGPVQVLPAWLVDHMTEAQPEDRALTSSELKFFFRQHTVEEDAKALNNVLRRYTTLTEEEGESRHMAAVDCLCWALRESCAGLYSAERAVTEIRDAFFSSLRQKDNARLPGEGEWQDVVSWAAAQAAGADAGKIRDEIEARRQEWKRQRREEQSADGMFHPQAGTDQEQAAEIIRWVSDQAVYARDAASWVLKDDSRWVVAPAVKPGAILALAAHYIPVGLKPEDEDSSEWTQANWDWHNRQRYQSGQKSSGISTKLGNLVSTRTSEEYTLSLSDTDPDPDALWTPNGPVDTLDDRHNDDAIDIGAVHLHCTKYSVTDMPTPGWDELTGAIWPDEEIRNWAMQLFSVGLTGISPRMFIYLHGGKGRGKTSVPSLIADALGTYGRDDLNSSMIGRDSKPWDRAVLHGLRFGFIDEMPSGAGGPTEVLKRITGGASINAEYKGKPQFTFKPTHTLVFASNTVPDMHDDAVVDRLRAIACSGNVRDIARARAKLGDVHDPRSQWQHEAPGVLWRLVQLARAYRRNADIIDQQRAPGAVKRATASLRADQDVLATWIEEYMTWLPQTSSKKEWLPPTRIYDEFLRWCKRNPRGRRYLNESYTVDSFGRELAILAKKIGQKAERYGGHRCWPLTFTMAKVRADSR